MDTFAMHMHDMTLTVTAAASWYALMSISKASCKEDSHFTVVTQIC